MYHIGTGTVDPQGRERNKVSFSVIMVLIWVLFGLLGCLHLPLLHLWLYLGIASVIVGFWLLLF